MILTTTRKVLLNKYGLTTTKLHRFENSSQMSIPNKTVLEIFYKVINKVDDLYKFYKEKIFQMAYNLGWNPPDQTCK